MAKKENSLEFNLRLSAPAGSVRANIELAASVPLALCDPAKREVTPPVAKVAVVIPPPQETEPPLEQVPAATRPPPPPPPLKTKPKRQVAMMAPRPRTARRPGPQPDESCFLLCWDEERLSRQQDLAARDIDIPSYTVVPWYEIFDIDSHGESVYRMEDYENNTLIVFGAHESDETVDTDESSSYNGAVDIEDVSYD